MRFIIVNRFRHLDRNCSLFMSSKSASRRIVDRIRTRLCYKYVSKLVFYWLLQEKPVSKRPLLLSCCGDKFGLLPWSHILWRSCVESNALNTLLVLITISGTFWMITHFVAVFWVGKNALKSFENIFWELKKIRMATHFVVVFGVGNNALHACKVLFYFLDVCSQKPVVLQTIWPCFLQPHFWIKIWCS